MMSWIIRPGRTYYNTLSTVAPSIAVATGVTNNYEQQLQTDHMLVQTTTKPQERAEKKQWTE
jgi:hypothetical protein